MTKDVKEKEMIGIFIPYKDVDGDYNCYKCGEQIKGVLFSIHREDKEGDLIFRNYHLKCSPKKIEKITKSIQILTTNHVIEKTIEIMDNEPTFDTKEGMLVKGGIATEKGVLQNTAIIRMKLEKLKEGFG